MASLYLFLSAVFFSVLCCSEGAGQARVTNPAWNCWSGCGHHGGLCERSCGWGGYCCRRGWGDCRKELNSVATPNHHTCVKWTIINECRNGNGGCQHTCVHRPHDGSHYCKCRPGYTLTNGKACKDTNECVSKSVGGSAGGCTQLCLNTPGSYKCACKKGFVLAADKKSCQDVNECGMKNGGCTHKCSNTLGSRKCSCNKGYTLLPDGKACRDTNECSIKNGGCSQLCSNKLGSYECRCKKDFVLAADKKSCKAKNPCLVNNGGCKGGVCVNNGAKVVCKCKPGFHLAKDKRTCKKTPTEAPTEQPTPPPRACPNTPKRCPMEKGFCLNQKGCYQYPGRRKLFTLNPKTVALREACLAVCLAYPGARGCEVVWNRHGYGCYAHLEAVAKGDGVAQTGCWVLSKCTNVPAQTVAPPRLTTPPAPQTTASLQPTVKEGGVTYIDVKIGICSSVLKKDCGKIASKRGVRFRVINRLSLFPAGCYHKKGRGVNKVYFNTADSKVACSALRRCICKPGSQVVVKDVHVLDQADEDEDEQPKYVEEEELDEEDEATEDGNVVEIIEVIDK